MLLSKKFIYFFPVIILLLLAACGFSPVNSQENWQAIYAKTKLYISGDKRLARDLEKILSAKLLQNKKQDKIAKEYNLEVIIAQNIDEFAITRHSFATRSKITVTATYKITEISSGNLIAKGSVSDASSFNISASSQYSNYISEQYSVGNSIKIVGDEIMLRLVAASMLKSNKG